MAEDCPVDSGAIFQPVVRFYSIIVAIRRLVRKPAVPKSRERPDRRISRLVYFDEIKEIELFSDREFR
jgi:hypothetical protein